MPYCYDYDKLGRLIYYKADARSGKKTRVKKSVVRGDPYPCSDLDDRRENINLSKINKYKEEQKEKEYNIPYISGSDRLKQFEDIEYLKTQVDLNNQNRIKLENDIVNINQKINMIENRQKIPDNQNKPYLLKDEFNAKMAEINSKIGDYNIKLNEINTKIGDQQKFSMQWQSLQNKMQELERRLAVLPINEFENQINNIKLEQNIFNKIFEENDIKIRDQFLKIKDKFENRDKNLLEMNNEYKNKFETINVSLITIGNKINSLRTIDKKEELEDIRKLKLNIEELNRIRQNDLEELKRMRQNDLEEIKKSIQRVREDTASTVTVIKNQFDLLERKILNKL